MPRRAGLVGAAADDFNRTGGLGGEGLRDAAHQDALSAATAMRPDDDTIRAPVAGFAKDDILSAIEENGDRFANLQAAVGEDSLRPADGGLGAGERFFAELLDLVGMEKRRFKQGMDGGQDDFDDAENSDLCSRRPRAARDGASGDLGVGRTIGGEEDFTGMDGLVEAWPHDGHGTLRVAERVGGDVTEEEVGQRVDAVGTDDN